VPTNPDRSSYFPAIEKKHGQPMSYWFDVMAEISDRKYPEQMAYLQENHGFSRAHANALVLYSRGSTTSRRFATLDDYLVGVDDQKAATVRAIFSAITAKYRNLETVIAWNQPMLKQGTEYIIGVSVAKQHILIGPWGNDVIARFADRLTGYEINKKTIRVPVDWKPDAKLLRDIVASRLAEIEA
jgi:uncharacterized protein YdhG (YjbR/CyaY superfamily)